MYKGHKIIDSHIHYALPIEPEELLAVMDASNTDMANLVIVPHRCRVSSVPDALMVKAMYPERFYVFGSLDVSAYFRYKKTLGKYLVKYASEMLRCGCDGIKIIESKPQIRKMLPIPDFDAPCWEPFFAWAEKEQVPIVWHINDPEEFWDEEKIPSWAKERGWLYDESYINNEVQYDQVKNVLKKHPKLKIIFAHFIFFSAQLERLCDWMESYPNIMIDLTPGIEMYINFSNNLEETKKIFECYADRIVYGTDIGARAVISGAGVDPSGITNQTVNDNESLRRCEIVREFLSSDGEFLVKADGNFLIGTEDFTLRGIGLSDESLEKIFSKNFESFVGAEPKAVNGRRVIKDCKRVKTTMRIMSMIDKSVVPDFACANRVIKYFKSNK